MKIEITNELYEEILSACAKESNVQANDIEIEKILIDKNKKFDIDYRVAGKNFERIRRITGTPQK